MTPPRHENIHNRYSYKESEKKWIDLWSLSEISGCNTRSNKRYFSMVLPPPNVTGTLHIGHALTASVQDLIIRWKKMCGFESVWIPGTDHAGIATQTVVDRDFLCQTGTHISSQGKQALLKKIWEWKDAYETKILSQQKAMGTLHDWALTRFSMDEQCSKATLSAFKKAFDENLIYRGHYLINWDPISGTALSDDEVIYEENEGFLWEISYLIEGVGNITIATTRPETIFADVAIAVHPDDSRFVNLIGKFATIPIIERRIPILPDTSVDQEFGTGALKITPGHDFTDYQLGKKHQLPCLSIIDTNGKLTKECGQFAGLTTQEARHQVVQHLKKINKIHSETPIKNRIAVSYRSGACIEPLISQQWFFKLSSFKDELLTAFGEGEFKLFPDGQWDNMFYNWTNGLRDWCISRQIVWGHRIPVWHNRKTGETICHIENTPPHQYTENPDDWYQDPDVLDTWFSSAIWPLSTLGWPDKTDLVKNCYPNSLSETGFDILFFWVTRMLVMCKFLCGIWPFKSIYLHGLIYSKSYWIKSEKGGITYIKGAERKDYDLGTVSVPPHVHTKWEKMSKSKGNVIDPLSVIEDYGTDSLRLCLISMLTGLRELDLDYKKFEFFRNFNNKLWNASRFVITKSIEVLEDTEKINISFDKLLIEDKWILSKLATNIKQLNSLLYNYEFSEFIKVIYSFFWHDFCDYYIEISKTYINQSTNKQHKQTKAVILLSILSCYLRLLHPAAPFITEEITDILKNTSLHKKIHSDHALVKDYIDCMYKKSCVLCDYPTSYDNLIDKTQQQLFEDIIDVVHTARQTRSEQGFSCSEKTDLYVVTNKEIDIDSYIFSSLIPIKQVFFTMPKNPENYFISVLKQIEVFVPKKKPSTDHMYKLRSQQENLISLIEKTTNLISDTSFIEKAPGHVIEAQKTKLQSYNNDLHIIEQKIKSALHQIDN